MSRIPVTYTLKDFFKSFLERNPKSTISSKEHKDIMDATGEVMKDIVIQEGDMRLFGRLGFMQIRRVKPRGDKKAPIDFNISKKEGCNVYHFNDHSDGYIARVIWDRGTCVIPDKHMWHFKPVRAFKRALASVMKSGKYEYLILTK